MIYIGIDPSYSKTGVTYLNTNTKEILFNSISPVGANTTYRDAVERAIIIKESILYHAPIELCGSTTLIFEEPLITSQMSSRLGLLSGVLATTFINDSEIGNIYTIHPNAVSHTNKGVRGYSSKARKSISLVKGLEYLEIFTKQGYTYTIYNSKTTKSGKPKQRKLSPDEAESFIILIKLLLHEGALPTELKQDLIKSNQGLLNGYEPIILKESEKD